MKVDILMLISNVCDNLRHFLGSIQVYRLCPHCFGEAEEIAQWPLLVTWFQLVCQCIPALKQWKAFSAHLRKPHWYCEEIRHPQFLFQLSDLVDNCTLFVLSAFIPCRFPTHSTCLLPIQTRNVLLEDVLSRSTDTEMDFVRYRRTNCSLFNTLWVQIRWFVRNSVCRRSIKPEMLCSLWQEIDYGSVALSVEVMLNHNYPR
jgi:hypothetical protein